MRALKILVVVLGIAVLLGFFGLIAGIVYKASRLAEAPATATPPATARPAWGRVGLDQPQGTRIHALETAGGYIVLHLYTDAPGIDERVVVVDPATGATVGTIVPGPR